MRHRGTGWFAVIVVVASLGSLVTATPPAVAQVGPAPSPPAPAPSADWHQVLDYYRSLAGYPPMVIDTGLTDAAVRQAGTITATGVVSGGDMPVPSASPSGPTAVLASGKGDVVGDRVAIDTWADSLASSVDLFSPHVIAVGVGQHTDPAASRLRTGSVAFLLYPSTHQRLATPRTVPQAGSVVSRRVFPESIDAAWAPCRGFPARSPVLLAYFPDAPSAPVAGFTRDGRPVRTCAFSAEALNFGLSDEGYARFGLLRNRAVAVVLGEPLAPGGRYEGAVTAAGQRATWSFTAAVEPGYWMVTADAAVSAFGAAGQHGQFFTGVPTTDIEPTATGNGYWLLDAMGSVSSFGDARRLGQVPPLAEGELTTSLSATPSGGGYWVFTSSGRVLPFGDARHVGDLAGKRLNGPVLGSVATPSGNGYYMVASDGGVFAFGDARFAGSMGGRRLNAPVRALVPDADGVGYWLVASDGGIFAFDAVFRGSMGGRPLNRPVSGMVRYGSGYLLVGEDGGIFSFSDLPFLGSLGGHPPTFPVVAVASL